MPSITSPEIEALTQAIDKENRELEKHKLELKRVQGEIQKLQAEEKKIEGDVQHIENSQHGRQAQLTAVVHEQEKLLKLKK